MPHTVEKEVYYFEELEDSSKERARDWYKSGALDYEWWDCTYDDCKEALEILGYSIDHIYFSGFSSQGDGACFIGKWYQSQFNPEKVRALMNDRPTDKDLHEIANSLLEMYSTLDTSAHEMQASLTHSGHYYHEMCVHIDVSLDCDKYDEDKECDINHDELEENFIETSRDAMRWVYRTLEKEYDWLMSDEQVDESIVSNEYEFSKDGKRSKF